jgi:hypothetical protein
MPNVPAGSAHGRRGAAVNELLRERAKTHGDFGEVARLTEHTILLWESSENWPRLTERQRCSLRNTLGKIARILSGDPNHPDHWVDGARYLDLAWMDLMEPVEQPIVRRLPIADE